MARIGQQGDGPADQAIDALHQHEADIQGRPDRERPAEAVRDVMVVVPVPEVVMPVVVMMIVIVTVLMTMVMVVGRVGVIVRHERFIAAMAGPVSRCGGCGGRGSSSP